MKSQLLKYLKNRVFVVLLLLLMLSGCQVQQEPQDGKIGYFSKSEKRPLDASWDVLKKLRLDCVYESGENIPNAEIFFGDTYFQRAEWCGDSQNAPVVFQEFFTEDFIKKPTSNIYANKFGLLKQCFWLRISSHENVGIAVREILREDTAKAADVYRVAVPRNQAFLLDFAQLLQTDRALQNVRGALWREESPLFFYASFELSENGTANVFLTPGKEYSLLIFYPLGDGEYAYHVQKYRPGGPIGTLGEPKKFTASLKDKRITKIYPFRCLPTLPAQDEDFTELGVTLYLSVSPFSTEPPESLFCAFYENDSTAELFGEPGTIAFSSEGYTPHLRPDFSMKPWRNDE